MKYFKLVILISLSAVCVNADIRFNDILNAQPEFINKTEAFLWNIIRENKAINTNQIVDIAVVGSFAQGCARVGGEDPSDIDIIIFVQDKKSCHFFNPKTYTIRLAKVIDCQLDIDISIQTTNMMEKNNPDWIAYSIVDRKCYGRPDAKPRNVKLIRQDGKWKAINRDKYNKLTINSESEAAVENDIILSDTYHQYFYEYKYLKTFPNSVYTSNDFVKPKNGSTTTDYGGDIFTETTTYSTDGALPDNLVLHLIDIDSGHDEDESEPIITDWNYEIYGIDGTITENTAKQGYNKVYHIHEETAYNSGDTMDWFYFYFFSVDDWADQPINSSHVGQLNLSEDYTEGRLYSQTNWFSNGEFEYSPPEQSRNIPADIDVFKISLDPGVYCVETQAALVWDPKPLEITVYEANGNNYGDQIAYVNVFDCFDDNGNIDNQHQRIYFLQETAGDVYIKINSTDPIFQGKYKIRVVKARPVILVHGINASPKSSSDPDTTFEHMRDCLGYFKEIPPCICYDFPWWSKDPDVQGFEKYVGKKKEADDSLFKFIYEKYDLHGDYKANIILHSMGGFIVRYQLNYSGFADMVNQVLFINSPQYGSDLANFIATRPDAAERFNVLPMLFTCQENYIHMCRGGETVWKMHHEKDMNIPASRIAFTVGTKRGLQYLPLPGIIFAYDYAIGRLKTFSHLGASIKTLLKDRYLIGLKRSDGIVPVTSQNLLNLEPNIPEANYYFIEKHHTEAQKLTLNSMNSCSELYNLIKARMNTQ